MHTHARQVAAAANVPFDEARFTVTAAWKSSLLEGTLPRQFEVYPLGTPSIRPDYVIASTRWHAESRFYNDYPVIGSVARRGMIFAVIKATPEILKFGGLLPSANGGDVRIIRQEAVKR